MFYYSKIGWRLGLQAVTGVVFLTFILGTFYRSASLYHPQRRAILHLKNQKRKIKDKNKGDDKPPFFDFSTLKSKTVRILLVSTGISAFGINTPIFYLVTTRTKFKKQIEAIFFTFILDSIINHAKQDFFYTNSDIKNISVFNINYCKLL